VSALRGERACWQSFRLETEEPVWRPKRQATNTGLALTYGSTTCGRIDAVENWPYGVLDDKTVDGIIRALDVQSEAGYNLIDPCGFWTTYAWPVDINKVADKDRVRRVNQVLKAATSAR